jgi:hypothetical protein
MTVVATNGTHHPAAPTAPEIYRRVTAEIYRLLHERGVSRVESVYYQLLLEIEDRRQALGVSMERLSWRWSTIQIIVDAQAPRFCLGIE